MIVQKELVQPEKNEDVLLPESPELSPGPVDEDDLLDWDVWLDNPPPRPERTMAVRLEYAGREAPLVFNTSSEE